MILIIPFGLIAVIGGFITYKLNQKAERELAQARIRSRLAEIERQKQAEAAGEPPVAFARTRRIRSRR